MKDAKLGVGQVFFLRRGRSQRIELGFRRVGSDHFGIFLNPGL
jgi:hypothetical protein